MSLRPPFDDQFLGWMSERDVLPGANVTARLSCALTGHSIDLTIVNGRLVSTTEVSSADVEVRAEDPEWLKRWAIGQVDIISAAGAGCWKGHPLALAVLVGCLPNPLCSDYPKPWRQNGG